MARMLQEELLEVWAAGLPAPWVLVLRLRTHRADGGEHVRRRGGHRAGLGRPRPLELLGLTLGRRRLLQGVLRAGQGGEGRDLVHPGRHAPCGDALQSEYEASGLIVCVLAHFYVGSMLTCYESGAGPNPPALSEAWLLMKCTGSSEGWPRG